MHADAPLTVVPVANSLRSAPASEGSAATGFVHGALPAPTPLRLPGTAAVSLTDLANATCRCDDDSCTPCFRDVVLELHVRVPHLTTKLTSLSLVDAHGREVLRTALPEEQQTRFALGTGGDASELLNIITVVLSGIEGAPTGVANATNSSHPAAGVAGDYSAVAGLELERAGRPDLANIDPADHPLVYWSVTSLRLRRGCKGELDSVMRPVACHHVSPWVCAAVVVAECGADPSGAMRENAVIALTLPGEEVELMAASTDLSHRALDVSSLVDPGCRCLAPSATLATSPALHLQVLLRSRTVWPSALALVDSATGVELWHAELPRASPDSVGKWQWVHLTLPSAANTWSVGNANASATRDGPVPPWHSVHLRVHRRALLGVPSASDVPSVKAVALMGGAPDPSGVFAAYALRGQVTLAPPQPVATVDPASGATIVEPLPTAVVDDGAGGTAQVTALDVVIPPAGHLGYDHLPREVGNTTHDAMALSSASRTRTEWQDWATVLGPDAVAALRAGECPEDSTCGGGYITVTVQLRLSSDAGAAFYPSVPSHIALFDLVVEDSNGNMASVSIPEAAGHIDVATPSTTLWLPLTPTSLNIVPPATTFDFHQVARLAFRQSIPGGGAPGDHADTGAHLLRVTVGPVRVGVPRRLGHVSSIDDYNVDDLACDPASGTFDVSPFVRHTPLRYGHCRTCCCYFDDPGNPDEKHCYEQGDVIAHVTPAESMAPNDQCAVCDRSTNPQVMSPANVLLQPGAQPPHAGCDDGEACTWNDRCTDEGACIGDVYTTCLISDFHGGDPSKNCEACDGTGSASDSKGCQARPSHYV